MLASGCGEWRPAVRLVRAVGDNATSRVPISLRTHVIHGSLLWGTGRTIDDARLKWKGGTYTSGPRTSWLKIRNPKYSQWENRRELFEARRDNATRRNRWV